MTSKDESLSIYKSICELFDEKNWFYEKDEEHLFLSGEAQGEDLKIPFRMFVDPEKMLITLVSRLPFIVPKQYRVDMAIAVCLVNYKLSDGNFDYNINTGEMIFRLTSSYRDSILGKQLYQYMFLCACFTVDDYNEKLYALSRGEITSEQFR